MLILVLGSREKTSSSYNRGRKNSRARCDSLNHSHHPLWPQNLIALGFIYWQISKPRAGNETTGWKSKYLSLDTQTRRVSCSVFPLGNTLYPGEKGKSPASRKLELCLPRSLTSLHLTGHLLHVYKIWMSLFLCSPFALRRHSQTLSNPSEIKPARAGLLLRWHASPQWLQHSHWQSRGAFSEACLQCFCGEALPGRQQRPFSINDLFWWTLMFWVNYTLVPFSLFPHEAVTWQQFLPAAGWTLSVCHLCRFLPIPSSQGWCLPSSSAPPRWSPWIPL